MTIALLALTGHTAPCYAAPVPSLVWMINTKALALLAAEPGGNALVEQFFDNAQTFVMAPRDQLALVPPKAIATLNFPSFAAMRAAFDTHGIDSRYGAVLYDCEAWAATPIEEQRNPVYYYGLAAQLAHNYHLKLIAAPATTLRKVLLRPIGPDKYPPFMRTGIIGPIAKVADIFEIQAQGLLPEPDKFDDLVRHAAAEAVTANSHIVFLAGLSTGPSGRTVTPGQLGDAVARTRSLVSGYWLNIPDKSAFCEACSKARPAIAAALLRQLQQSAGP